MPTTTTTTKKETKTTTRTSDDNERRVGMHPRFNAWVCLMVLSMVAMICIISDTKDKQSRDFQERWSLAMACVSMCLGFLAALGHGVSFLRHRFVSTIIEAIMAMAAVGAWVFGIPMITSPKDGLAVREFIVTDANMYFASWGAFIFALWILASVMSERCAGSGRAATSSRWLCLIVASCIVMASASRMFDKRPCDGDMYKDTEYCKELKMGISLSVVSAVIAGIMTLLLYLSPAVIPVDFVGLFLCVVCIVIWCVCLARLTFENGPGSLVGNLFFSVWASAILAFDLAVCYVTSFLN